MANIQTSHRHDNRSCRYRQLGWVGRCRRYEITRSTSRKGCSPDNSAMEGFFCRLKVGFFYGQDRKGRSIGRFMETLGDCIERHDERRIEVSSGGLSPNQYRRSLGLAA